jgi:uncharacterized membrane protein
MNINIKDYIKAGKQNLIAIYILNIISIIMFPPFLFLGAYFSYSYKNHKSITWRSHYIFILRTLIFGLIGAFASILTTFIFIGPIISMLVFVWFAVRTIVALQLLLEENPHPNPLTFWIK